MHCALSAMSSHSYRHNSASFVPTNPSNLLSSASNNALASAYHDDNYFQRRMMSIRLCTLARRLLRGLLRLARLPQVLEVSQPLLLASHRPRFIKIGRDGI